MKFSILKSSLFKNTAIYTITDGISKGLAFLTLPLISHYLIPEELGIAANFDVLQNILMLLAGQAVINSMPYFFYGKTKEEKSNIVSSLFFIVIVSNILFSFLILLFTAILEDYLHIGILLQILTIVSVVAHLISCLNLVLYRLEDKPYIFAKLQIAQTVLYLTALVIFVVVLRMSALGKILSVIVSFSLMAIVHIVLLIKRDYLKLSINIRQIKILLRFGLPLLPHSLSFWFKSGFDKVIITAYCGLSTNGLYSMAMSFGALYTIFNTAFSNSYPLFTKEDKLFYRRYHNTRKK